MTDLVFGGELLRVEVDGVRGQVGCPRVAVAPDLRVPPVALTWDLYITKVKN